MAYAKVYWLITVRRNRWGWYNTPATLDDHTPSAAEDWIYERVTAPFKKVNCRRIQLVFSNQLWCALPVKLMWWTSFPETGDLDGGTGQWFLFYEILGASWDIYASSFVRYVRLREICAPPLKSAISCFTPTWIGNNLPWNDKEQVLQRLKDTINSFGNLVYINLKRALWNFTTFIACAKLLSSCNNVKYSSKAKYCIINILTWEPIQIEANTERK